MKWYAVRFDIGVPDDAPHPTHLTVQPERLAQSMDLHDGSVHLDGLTVSLHHPTLRDVWRAWGDRWDGWRRRKEVWTA